MVPLKGCSSQDHEHIWAIQRLKFMLGQHLLMFTLDHCYRDRVLCVYMCVYIFFNFFFLDLWSFLSEIKPNIP